MQTTRHSGAERSQEHAKLYQAVDDLDIFTAFPIAKKFDKFRLAQLGYELGKYMHIKVHMPKIKERYEFERNQAIDLLTNGADERLHQLAGIAGATTVESERQAYDRADHGLEQHLSSAPYDAWSAVDEPHPTPESVHITPERMGHILEGDPPPSTGGGHMYGTGRAGKTEFPKGWDEKYISGHVLDVVKHPDSPPIKQSNGAWRVSGVRDGVLIEVAVRDDGYVVTAYPASGPGVNENPRGL